MSDHTVILDETMDDGVVCESQWRIKINPSAAHYFGDVY